MILGPTRLRADDGTSVKLGVAKQRQLLTLLLLHARQPVPLTLIVERLWNNRPPAAYRQALWSMASRIRGILDVQRMQAALASPRGLNFYRLDIDPGLVDVHRFRSITERARDAARTGRHDRAVDLFETALALWQEPPLADLQSDGSEHDRHHLREQVFINACKGLFESQLIAGEYGSVVTRLAPLIEARPLDETLVRQWIQALDGTGQFSKASSDYLTFDRQWRDAVGTEPNIEVRAAYQHMLEKRRHTQPGAGSPGTEVLPFPFTPPHQLRRDITDFTGQRASQAELDRLSQPTAGSNVNVVVIDGMPGVGKTTLAVHWAHQHLDRFPDGQIQLDANAYGATPPIEPEDALGRFLHALGVPTDRIPPDSEHRRSRLNQLLTGRRLLILLDNVHDSQQVRPLLPATPTCLMIITSRSRLKSLVIREGLRSVTVAPLSTEESVALLRGLIGPSRSDAEPEALAELAERAAGLPLALRIIGQYAAERPLVQLGDLVGQLTERLLAPEDEFDEEDATVRAVFSWSYCALPDEVARLFRLLGLHPGRSISTETAAALLGTDHTRAERMLERLVSASLIDHASVGRFRLHDLLRQFAGDRCRDEDPADARRAAAQRMLDFYLLSGHNAVLALEPELRPVPDLPPTGTVAAMTFRSDAGAMEWFAAERANITAVTRFAADNGFHTRAWQIPATVYEAYNRYGHQDDVLETQQIALRSARASCHGEAELGTHNSLGATHRRLGNYKAAAEHYRAGLALAEQQGHLPGQAVCSLNLGITELELGDLRAAIALHEQALHIYRRLGDTADEAFTLFRLGNVHRRMADTGRAFTYYHKALAGHERATSLRGQGATHAELASLYLDTGDLANALVHGQHALDIDTRTRDRAVTCETLATMAAVHNGLGLLSEALHEARLALDMCDEIADSRRRARTLSRLRDTFTSAGDANRARRAALELNAIMPDTVER